MTENDDAGNATAEGDKLYQATSIPLSHLGNRSVTQIPDVEPRNPDNDGASYYIPRKSGAIGISPNGVLTPYPDANFVRLTREPSTRATHPQPLHGIVQAGFGASNGVTIDIEKAASISNEQFDINETLRGAKTLNEEANIKSKHIGVLWEGLTVKGLGGSKNFVRIFPDAFISFFNVPGLIMSLLGYKSHGQELEILKDFKGLVKPGEMVLVLGRPSSGCSTFLRLVSNQRFGYTKISGDVHYGPFDADTFASRYRGEAVYNQEDDIHVPSLSVRQTLAFALDLKTPGKRPIGMTKAEFKEKAIRLLLYMLNIQHTENTKVGGAFINGISGGEKKRLSIAEMMVSSACICAWDNSTRGLDASTASDFIKSLRLSTDVYKTTTFVSLYQASETIYNQFEKVMVIDSGRQVFFGPTTEARAYFERLGFKEKPRQTTPDYLTGCTDAYEREYKHGFSSANAPYDAVSLASTFLGSEYAARLDVEMAAYRKDVETKTEAFRDFETAHRESKRKHVSRKSVYTAPLYLQIWILTKRQFMSKWQDTFALAVSWATSMLIAIVIGTVWWKQPQNSAGAFTRGGLLFTAFLFNAFQAIGELPNTMLGRPVVNKHRAFTFYRPSALWLGQIVVDTTFASVQCLVFSIIVYFMCGLALDVSGFVIFVFVIITGYLSMTVFFRTVGCLCSEFDSALRIAVILVTLFVITSGYLIQYPTEQIWLRWIYYVNGLGLGFSALMINEFGRINLTCTPESLIPSGPGYADVDSDRACALAGGLPGSDIIPGSFYIAQTFLYDSNELWRNIGIILVLIISFLIFNVALGEFIPWGAGGRTITYFAKENPERRILNFELLRRKKERLEHGTNQGPLVDVTSKAVLTWESLCYEVQVHGGMRRLLLRDVHGYVKPGTLTALMGASGAGKTTLLDVLAARKNIGIVSGSILVDGTRPGISFQRGTAYAEQSDVHEPTQTVREALRFSASLRQAYGTPVEEKYAYVEEIISLLEMEDIADAIIGTPESGLAMEQRKRVTIGVELAAKPELLLFLDEPTSGLDSQSAFNIVRFLKKLATAGQSILCTIHQPNSALFETFDRLLLLQQGGECVYFGDIGKDASVLREYFSRHGANCPLDINPAEFMLNAIGAGTMPRLGEKDWAETWRDSSEFAQTKLDIVNIKATRINEVGEMPESGTKETEYATPLLHQIKVVNARMHLAFWRSPNYGFTRLFNHVIVALITGLTYFQLDDSRTSLQYRVFIIFQVTVIAALILASVEPRYDLARSIFYRESASKAYRQFPFAFSMVIAEMPYSIICAVGFFLPLYYLPGLQMASDRAGYQFLMILTVEVFSVTLGQMISAITPSTYIAMLLNPPIMIVFSLLCGVTVPEPQIPGFWRAWLYELNPYTRLISGMVVTELHGLDIVCQPQELNIFTAPPGQTCGEYMAPYFAQGGLGYIVDNMTSNCEYCAYKFGEQFYENLGISFENRWRDLGIMAAFIGSNLILLFLGSRYMRYNQR